MPDRFEQIEDIFNRALEHDPTTRAAFIAEACAGDEALRHEVVSLLRYEKAARHFIESPAIEALAGEIGDGGEPLPPGYAIGPYVVVSLLGEGGMGEVYRARDPNLDRDVAIKALPAAFALDMARVRRLEREARLLASLNHPNIAAIYGLEQALGMQFLILELVEGQTLADRLSGGAIPVQEALGIASQLAEALEAAHASNVIHRDLKPSNVRMTRNGRVKILDFGLAKATTDKDDLPRALDVARPNAADTRHGAVMGTLAYMSPEQARGEAVDHRTDIWAFGCVLFEMLTGCPAWTRDSVDDLVAWPSPRGPEMSGLPPRIHPGVPALIRRCLSAAAEDRPKNAREVRMAIEAVLSHHPDDPWAFAARRRRSGSIAVGLTAALACVATGAVWALGRSWRPGAADGTVCRFCGGRLDPHRCAPVARDGAGNR